MLTAALLATPAFAQQGAAAPASGAPPAAQPTTIQAALANDVGGLSDSDLKTNVKMFGRDTTKQGAALMLLFDQHEHLGQSIAYARSNSVVPPWSK